ncbi:MAG: lytic transglycosylase domain-containing protein [Myxococcota bacterium]
MRFIRQAKFAIIAVALFPHWTNSNQPHCSRVETNFNTNIRSLHEQNNENLKNAISLLIMSKNGDIPYSLVEKISMTIIEKSVEYDFDPLFIATVIYKESEYNPFAISPVGAAGLMQLMPKYFDSKSGSVFDIEANIEKGTAELYRLREKYGNYTDMLIAYLAGEQMLKNYKNGEIMEETAIAMNYYSHIILLNYQILSARFRINTNTETEILSMY